VEFYEDEQLDARFRSRLADFRDSGYDRGHLVRVGELLGI
jgi:DNA/RNA endonuclease G (NUC1)